MEFLNSMRIQKYICFTHPNAPVSQFLQNYNMVNAAKDNSCNVYNSHNNQTNNACWLALKPLANIIQAAVLQHCIIAYCTFHYAYYNSDFEKGHYAILLIHLIYPFEKQKLVGLIPFDVIASSQLVALIVTIALWGSCNGKLGIGIFHFWERNISGIFGHG